MRLNSTWTDRMAVIRVPKPPKSAYNPRRRPGILIQNQLTHLQWAALPAGERKPGKFRVKPAKTEAEAAARIETLTDQIKQQEQAAKKAATARRPSKAKPRAATSRRKSKSSTSRS
jgi:hypothetical protein